MGPVAKGLENKQAIIDRLGGLGAPLTQMYIADTSQKANPVVYVATVTRVITDNGLHPVWLTPA